MTLPKYNDEEALLQWVGERLAEQYDEDEMEHYLRPWGEAPAVRTVMTEAAAIRAAEDGNFNPLACMVEEGDDLGPGARAVIASKMRGTFKVKRRRPKRTAEQTERHPCYWASKEADDIVELLDRFYPKHKKRMDTAVTIAARRAGIKRKALESYRKS
ncbi:hypothetical protein JQ543_05450 [Bradyrhizobium diazoefficiens]|nr:hypothetical protein [Bradyrhizobium diazoefficiens]MBR0847187.1 hypothetical protein [Bradyrhizobium diazoefficiens]